MFYTAYHIGARRRSNDMHQKCKRYHRQDLPSFVTGCLSPLGCISLGRGDIVSPLTSPPHSYSLSRAQFDDEIYKMFGHSCCFTLQLQPLVQFCQLSPQHQSISFSHCCTRLEMRETLADRPTQLISVIYLKKKNK